MGGTGAPVTIVDGAREGIPGTQVFSGNWACISGKPEAVLFGDREKAAASSSLGAGMADLTPFCT